MEFHFRSGASLHLQRFTVSSGGPASMVGHPLAGLFVNGTDVTSWCCPVVTCRLSIAVKVQRTFAGVTPRIFYPRSVLTLHEIRGTPRTNEGTGVFPSPRDPPWTPKSTIMVPNMIINHWCADTIASSCYFYL